MNSNPTTPVQLATVVKKEVLFKAKWLGLHLITYIDEFGVKREWESVERTTRKESASVDAVSIFAFLKKKNQPDQVILVKQFRPPVGKYSIENPAGLVDGDESAEHAAIRELKEETGYVANKILHVSLESFSDLGICNACSKIVHLEVDGDDPVNQNPQKHNDEGEYTEVILVPLNQLYQSLVEYQRKGYSIPAKLHGFAYGLHCAQQ